MKLNLNLKKKNKLPILNEGYDKKTSLNILINLIFTKERKNILIYLLAQSTLLLGNQSKIFKNSLKQIFAKKYLF